MCHCRSCSVALLIAKQDKTNSVIDLYKDILRAVEDLATCSYTTEAFTELLSRIQAAVRRERHFTLSIAKAPVFRSIVSILKAMRILIIGSLS